MIYLGSLNNAGVLRKIAEDYNPRLIYFICYLGDPNKFKLDSRIFDRELDCKKLVLKDITIFERPVHLHKGICELTPPGRVVFQELIEHGICKEIQEFLNKKDEEGNPIFLNLDSFINLFNDTFSFKIDPNNLIDVKRKELIETYQINIAPDKHKILIAYNSFLKIKYYLYEEELRCKVFINCACSNTWEEEIINLKDNLKYYIYFRFSCSKCEKEF